MPHIENALLQISNVSNMDELRNIYPGLIFPGEELPPSNSTSGRKSSHMIATTTKNPIMNSIQVELICKTTVGIITDDQLPEISRAVKTLTTAGIEVELRIRNL